MDQGNKTINKEIVLCLEKTRKGYSENIRRIKADLDQYPKVAFEKFIYLFHNTLSEILKVEGNYTIDELIEYMKNLSSKIYDINKIIKAQEDELISEKDKKVFMGVQKEIEMLEQEKEYLALIEKNIMRHNLITDCDDIAESINRLGFGGFQIFREDATQIIVRSEFVIDKITDVEYQENSRIKTIHESIKSIFDMSGKQDGSEQLIEPELQAPGPEIKLQAQEPEIRSPAPRPEIVPSAPDVNRELDTISSMIPAAQTNPVASTQTERPQGSYYPPKRPNAEVAGPSLSISPAAGAQQAASRQADAMSPQRPAQDARLQQARPLQDSLAGQKGQMQNPQHMQRDRMQEMQAGRMARPAAPAANVSSAPYPAGQMQQPRQTTAAPRPNTVNPANPPGYQKMQPGPAADYTIALDDKEKEYVRQLVGDDDFNRYCAFILEVVKDPKDARHRMILEESVKNRNWRMDDFKRMYIIVKDLLARRPKPSDLPVYDNQQYNNSYQEQQA